MIACREVPEKVDDRLIVALDVPSISEARTLIDALDGVVSFFKVGLWLQFAAGFDGLPDYLVAKSHNIFLVLCSKRHYRRYPPKISSSRKRRRAASPLDPGRYCSTLKSVDSALTR